MTIKIEVSKKLQKLLKPNSNDGLLAKTRKQFSKTGTARIKRAVVQDMIRGVSPVKGKGKWVRYSPSYKAQIKGKVRFFSKGGRVFAAKAPKGKKIQNDVTKNARPTKQISPVNLRLTGKLHRSLKVFSTGGFLRNFRLVFQFKHFLADIHNRRGAGKSKVTRRLLPTEKGERFNKKIEDTIFNELKKAVNFVAKQFS